MKFSELEKGTRAIKVVSFRLGNAPLVEGHKPGDPIPEDEFAVRVGLRIMTGEELARVYKEARAAAFAAGCKEWLDSDPVCRLYEPFFDRGVQQVLSSPELGADNIAYLFEQHRLWEDEANLRVDGLTLSQIWDLMAKEAARSENAVSPLARLRPGALKIYTRTTAVHLATLLMAKSEPGGSSEESSTASSAN
jgi:hypothetical protein